MNGILEKPVIDFESEIILKAHDLSKPELQKEIDKRIVSITSGRFKGEKLDHLKKEAEYLAVMILRRG
jgi:hypothetical protein